METLAVVKHRSYLRNNYSCQKDEQVCFAGIKKCSTLECIVRYLFHSHLIEL